MKEKMDECFSLGVLVGVGRHGKSYDDFHSQQQVTTNLAVPQ